MFSSERRKAKILNFSIAYGKTAHGLRQDWGVTQARYEGPHPLLQTPCFKPPPDPLLNPF
eukprot:6946005-Pyramimonas_sp.AAC.1